MRDATLVTTQAQLETAVFRLESAARLAIDTEFMRERTYYPQLCLVQVATDSDCFLVDPLVGLELDALHALLADRSKLKILHAARQDLEVLQLGGRPVPVPVFDTQVAAAMLGFPPQVGYAELVARQLGHSIDKAQTRTDWSRRPLTPAQLAYAADDVHHLLQLHTDLATALAAKGRAEWLAEDADALEDRTLYQTEPADAWRRLKGLGRLKPREQAAARAIAEWRERRAIESDKPRGWILADEVIYALATIAPRTVADLEAIPSLPPAVVRKRGEELLALMRVAVESPDVANVQNAQLRATPEENALIAKLQQIVRNEAASLTMSSEVIATRRDVEALVFKDRGESAVLRGWRRGVVGEKLLSALEKQGT
jgi:ribonuclease D